MFKKQAVRITKWAVIPLILLAFAIILSVSYLMSMNDDFIKVSYHHSVDTIHANNRVIFGSFTAREKYLKSITLRFQNKDQLYTNLGFKISTLDAILNHEATISATQYNAAMLRTFDIPVVEYSKNRTFFFKIDLGNNNQGYLPLIMSKKSPILISVYHYPKSVLFENKVLLFEIILKKLIHPLYDDLSSRVLIFYCLPIMMYILYIFLSPKLISPIKLIELNNALFSIFKPYLLFIFYFIFVDINFNRKYFAESMILYIFLWIEAVITYRYRPRNSLIVSLILLLISPFLLLANMSIIAEKASVWAYVFLTIGVCHSLFKLKRNEGFHLDFIYVWLNFIPVFITNFFTLVMNLLKKILRTKFVYYYLRIISERIKHIDTTLITYSRRIVYFLSQTIIDVDYIFIGYVKKMQEFALFSFKNFLKLFLLFLISFTVFLIGFDIYLRAIAYRDRLMKNPIVKLIEPTYVYPGTKIVIYGERFGDNSDSHYAVKYNGNKIRTDYWEDHKIILTVPLDWKKPEDLKIWIERPIEWNGAKIIERTKPVTVKLLEVSGKIQPEDDLYFKQISSWQDETKEINGYK